jgi:type IV fimbrial biogenesis protein FimT
MCEAQMNRIRGFTLIELLVTMTVLAIIAAFAAPSFNGLIRSIRIDGDLSSIRSALTYARSEAVNSQGFVTVCSTNDSINCTGEEDWAVGWMVFLNDADDQAFNAGNDVLLRVWEAPLSPGASLEETNDRAVITYNDEGMVSANSDLIELSLQTEGCGEGQLRTIDVTQVGRIDITVGDCP